MSRLHGRLDLPDALPLYQAYLEMPLASISGAAPAKASEY
jgi:hypothetical protein